MSRGGKALSLPDILAYTCRTMKNNPHTVSKIGRAACAIIGAGIGFVIPTEGGPS